MGPFLSSGFGAAHLSFLIGFFVRPGVPFLRPDPQYYKAGARRARQGWPRLRGHPKGLALTGTSTAARLSGSGLEASSSNNFTPLALLWRTTVPGGCGLP